MSEGFFMNEMVQSEGCVYAHYTRSRTGGQGLALYLTLSSEFMFSRVSKYFETQAHVVSGRQGRVS